jgi:hypothetical protein
MLNNRVLSRPQWERKLRSVGAIPLEGQTALNSAEWWIVPGRVPFTVPIEEDGSCEFWAIQRICKELRGGWWF